MPVLSFSYAASSFQQHETRSAGHHERHQRDVGEGGAAVVSKGDRCGMRHDSRGGGVSQVDLCFSDKTFAAEPTGTLVSSSMALLAAVPADLMGLCPFLNFKHAWIGTDHLNNEFLSFHECQCVHAQQFKHRTNAL